MDKASRVLIVLAVFLLPVLCPAGQSDAISSSPLPFSFQHYRLRNGLRVILSEDGRLPLVTVAVAYSAGTLREKPGQEGLAYLLENLMFQGSENVLPLQHVAYVQKVGGTLNATTEPDKALFYETLPANQLALALWLESDRMKSLAITPAAIRQTREELIAEHKSRLASDPYLGTFAQFDALLFPSDLYGRPLIGDGKAMSELTESAIVDFYRTYYVPNNAVLCIVGDIDAARTRELVARYFDAIPPGLDSPIPPQPVFKRESDAVVRFAPIQSGSAGFHMGFRFFPLQAGEAYCLPVLEYILLEGETSQLRSRLLRHDLSARYLSGTLDQRLSVAAIKVFCLATNAVMVARSEKAVLAEIDRLKTNNISPEEIGRAKRRYKKDTMDRLSTNLGKARYLVDAWAAVKDLDKLGGELEAVQRVTPQALTAFANRYFTPQNRVVLEFAPQ